MKILLSLEQREHFQIAHRVKDYVDGFKINHIMSDYLASEKHNTIAKLEGYSLKRTKEVFFDFKLWDTPNTVQKVVEQAIKRGATMTTICTHNNDAVFSALEQYQKQIKLLGVTYLTSWSPQDQYDICGKMPIQMWQNHLDRIDGFYGVICSPEDIEDIEITDFEPKFKRVCPGIHFDKPNSGQSRSVTPKEAKDLGADYIVLGRTVTEAENPNDILSKIKESL